MLGLGVVDGDDGISENFFPGHAFQTNDAGRCFLGSSDNAGLKVLSAGMQNRNEVRPVVHGDMRSVIEGLIDMLVVGGVVLAFDGENRDPGVADERSGDIVLRAQGV